MSMSGDEQAGPMTERIEPLGVSEVGQSSIVGPAPETSRVSSQSQLEHSVELHIEELVLQGFASEDRYRVGEAIQRELTRLLIEQGAPTAITHDGEIAQPNRGAFEIRGASHSGTIGMQLAKAIYEGLGK